MISNPGASLQYYELAGGDAHAVGANAVWTNWDISAIVPVGTHAVSVSARQTVAVVGPIGARENGSALARTQATSENVWQYWTVLVDALRIIEIYSFQNNGSCLFNILGYWA